MPPSRFVRPVGFALLLGLASLSPARPSWNASRKRAGWRTAAPIEGNADLGVAARVLEPFFSRISYSADLVRVGRPVWKGDIVCSGLFDELVFASIRAPCLETDLQFNSAKIYIYVFIRSSFFSLYLIYLDYSSLAFVNLFFLLLRFKFHIFLRIFVNTQ